VKCVNSNMLHSIIGKINGAFKDFVAGAKDWALMPRHPPDFAKTQALIWVPLTPEEIRSIICTAFVFYLDALIEFSIIDNYTGLSIRPEQYIGGGYYTGVRAEVAIAKNGNVYCINEFYEF